MRISLMACLAAVLMAQAGTAGACTVFAAAGPELVPSGGTLVGKVRDERPAKQIVKTVVPGDGYAFVGLFVGDNERYNMGVNEKGLVVFRTTAGSIPKKVRSRSVRYKSPAGFSGHEQIIRHCATVEEALKSGVFLEPTNYVIADRKRIAYVEVLPDGTLASQVYDRGRFAHTTHYLMPEHQAANVKIGESSRIRYERITKLMDEQAKPYSMEDFIAWTKDRHDGPNNSIERIGVPGKSCLTTLSAMVVHIPPAGDPEIYLRWRENPAVEDMSMAKEERSIFVPPAR